MYILISSSFYGFSNAFWKKAIQNVSFLQVIIARGIYTTSFFGLCYWIDGEWGIFQPWLGEMPDFSLVQLALSVGLCFFSAFGLYFFVQALKSESVSLVAPISTINLFGLLTAVFILGESWTFSYSLATIFIVVGILLIFYRTVEFRLIDFFLKALKGGILTSFFWGVSYTLFKFPISWLGVIPFSFLLELCVTICAGMIFIFQNQEWERIPQQPVLILAICLILGSVCMHIAYQTASVSQIIFISKAQLIFTLIYGQFLYKEKRSFIQWVGILFLVFAIYIVT